MSEKSNLFETKMPLKFTSFIITLTSFILTGWILSLLLSQEIDMMMGMIFVFIGAILLALGYRLFKRIMIYLSFKREVNSYEVNSYEVNSDGVLLVTNNYDNSCLKFDLKE